MGQLSLGGLGGWPAQIASEPGDSDALMLRKSLIPAGNIRRRI